MFAIRTTQENAVLLGDGGDYNKEDLKQILETID